MSTVSFTPRTLAVTPLKQLTLAVSAILLVSGCSNTSSIKEPIVTNKSPVVTKAPTKTPVANTAGDFSTAYLDADSLDELADLLEATDMTIVEDNKLAIQKYGDLWNRLRAGYRMNHGQYGYNARIEAQKSWFSSRQDYLNRLTARSSRYLYHTVREAERRNIPTELALLPVIESSYDPSATSNAAAAGLWQFIPSTGRIYGLNQNSSYDGRRDVIESTRAAYDFLTALHNQFGSWELALAAYNAGPGRIQKAIDANAAQGLPTDFWSLRLPTETQNYVPRFLAVADIVAQPQKYGVYLPAIANRQHFRSVPVSYGTTLSQVSQVTGVSIDELQKLNPALLAQRVDTAGPQRVVIPNDVNVNMDAKLTTLGGTGAGTIMANQPTPDYNSKPYPNGSLPSSSSALADYAASASVPMQTTSYIPPTVSPTSSSVYSSQANVIKEPPIKSSELQKINAELKSSNSLPTTSAQVTQNNTIVQEPPLSQAERDFIAKQIQQQTPAVSDVISSVDGNIKLAAVQTQQSVLEAKGQEKKLSFATPANTTASKPKPQGTRSTYTVKRGDTLSNIATRAGVNWRDIAEWNQINPNANLLAGSTLYLYNAKPITATSTDTPTAPAIPESYIVQSGDTLIGTANRFGISVSELASYNNISSSSELLRGQRLWLIPGKVASSKAPAPSASSSSSRAPATSSYSGKTTTYTVKSGDGLIALAREYGVSTETLASLNGLSSTSNLFVGQRLKVPATTVRAPAASSASSSAAATPSSSYSGKTTTYTVKAGDGLIALARDYNVSTETLAGLNGLTATSNLFVGQRLKVPATTSGSSSSSSASTATSSSSSSAKYSGPTSTYKVKSGDTLIGIANEIGMSAEQVAAINNFNANARLQLGQTIKLPVSQEKVSVQLNNEAIKYKVKSGDTLTGVAARHGVTVSNLAAANNMSTSTNLILGRTITIPAKGATVTPVASSSSSNSSSAITPAPSKTASTGSKLSNTESYKVQSGDSLIGLARKLGVSVDDLAATNNMASNAQLQRGQTLQVPKVTVTYTVQSGDGLIALARKYGISTEELAKMNNISADTQLQRGQKLTVPNR